MSGGRKCKLPCRTGCNGEVKIIIFYSNRESLIRIGPVHKLAKGACENLKNASMNLIALSLRNSLLWCFQLKNCNLGCQQNRLKEYQHITKKHRKLMKIARWGCFTSHLVCVFLKDLLMSDRQRVSRREPVKGKEETPADVAYATLVAVYPEAWGGCHPWGIGTPRWGS